METTEHRARIERELEKIDLKRRCSTCKRGIECAGQEACCSTCVLCQFTIETLATALRFSQKKIDEAELMMTSIRKTHDREQREPLIFRDLLSTTATISWPWWIRPWVALRVMIGARFVVEVRTKIEYVAGRTKNEPTTAYDFVPWFRFFQKDLGWHQPEASVEASSKDAWRR